MKKLLFGIGAIIFGVIFSFFMGNYSFAQEEKEITPENSGIKSAGDCLTGMGKGCFDYEKTIGINKRNITVMSIVQDAIRAATYMVGTILSIVIIWCGFGFIIASADGKDTRKYKDGLKYAAIGALLVWGAYAIVRLIQYIAKG